MRLFRSSSAFQPWCTLTCLAGLMFVAACGGGGGGSQPAPTPAAVAPAITTQPANQTATAGQPATFSVVATGTAPLHYQWKKGSTAAGTDAASLALATTAVADAGSYTVTITNAAGSVTSTAAMLTIQEVPTITTQPANVTVTAGLPASFSVVATGTAPLHYQWKVGTTAIGSDAATLTLPLTLLSDSGSYTVAVTNAAGSVTSTPAVLTVVAPLKRIVYQRSVPLLGGGGTQTDLYAVNEDGTGDVALAASQDYEYLAMDYNSDVPTPAILGDRVIYLRRVSGAQDDIYSVKTDGTGTVALAATAAAEYFSAILGDRVVITKSAGGFLTVKADGSSPVAFPADAGLVGTAFGRVFYNSALASGTQRFYSALPDGTGSVELLNMGGQLLYRYTPNGAQITLTSGNTLFFYGANGTNASPLYATGADGTGKALLASNAAYMGNGRYGTFAGGSYSLPVADRFVYQTATELFSVKLDGTGTVSMGLLPSAAFFSGAIGTRALLETYTASVPSLLGADITSSAPTLLAAGGKSGMTSGNRAIIIRNDNYPTFDFSSINPDGTAEASLAIAAYPRVSNSGDATVNYRALAFSGNRILFRKQIGTPSTALTPDIISINNDGTGLITLVTGGEKDTESLNSGRLYFQRIVNSQSDLYSILLDGTGLVTLANGATDERFGLLVGTKVVFTRKAVDGHRDLYIVNGDGTGEKLLSNSADDKSPVAAF